jgi:hypothetical protein
MNWIRRCLAVIHLALGLIFVAGGVSYLVLGVFGLPQLLTTDSRTRAPGTLVLVTAVVLLPELALGAAMLVLARWLWLGHPRLRAALPAVHSVALLLGALFIKWGFDAVAAAERSTARGGGLLSPVAFFPFVVGVPLLVFALASIAAALWVVPRHEPDSRSTAHL